MSDHVAQNENSIAETQSGPKDLRAELQANLISNFSKNLYEAVSLPNAAYESLVTLLSNANTTSSDVIKALDLDDPSEPEVTNG